MTEDAAIYRSKEQVLYDLSKALQFSPESLEANRKGQLSQDQFKKHASKCFQPVILTLIFTVAPFVVWARITSTRQEISFFAGFPALITELAHLKVLFEAHGKMGGVMMLGSILISLAMAVLLAFRISSALCFDLLERRVITKEGRVVAREEVTNRANGRDPIEHYFFSLRYLNMPVNLAAYRALEPGSIYLVYLLPRSETLVSIEPKVEGAPDPNASRAVAEAMSTQGSTTRI